MTAVDPVYNIIAKRKRYGIEAITADESAEIKGFLRECVPSSEGIFATIVELFPIEYDEFLIESGQAKYLGRWDEVAQ